MSQKEKEPLEKLREYLVHREAEEKLRPEIERMRESNNEIPALPPPPPGLDPWMVGRFTGLHFWPAVKAVFIEYEKETGRSEISLTELLTRLKRDGWHPPRMKEDFFSLSPAQQARKALDGFRKSVDLHINAGSLRWEYYLGPVSLGDKEPKTVRKKSSKSS